MDDILKGVADDTAKIEAGDQAGAAKIAEEIMKTVSLFYDTTGKGAATDLYYCTFGPFASADLKPTVDKARDVVSKLMAAIEKKFGKELAEAQAKVATATATSPRFLQLHERLLHKKNRANPLALLEAQAELRVWDWVANLYNWAASVWGWVPYWQGHMQPAHCNHGGQLFAGCQAPSRAWAQTAANCLTPISTAAGAAVAGGCDWWSGQQVCPVGGAAAAVPGAPAAAILGPGGKIDALCGNPTRDAANKINARINDCRAQNYNKLHLWAPNWSQCVNLQWSYCQTIGGLPGQGAVGKVRVLVPPQLWNVNQPNLRITQQEMCALHYLCQNNADLWRAGADFVFTCNPVAGAVLP